MGIVPLLLEGLLDITFPVPFIEIFVLTLYIYVLLKNT